MQRLVPALLATTFLTTSLAATAPAATPPAPVGPTAGGAPSVGDTTTGGGVRYGQRVAVADPAPKSKRPTSQRPKKSRPAPRRRARGPVLAAFAVTKPRLYIYGNPARIDFRIDDRSPSVRVRLRVLSPTSRVPVRSIDLGDRPTGTPQSYSLTGREGGPLPEGTFQLRLVGRNAAGRRMTRPAHVSGADQLEFRWHHFPLAGDFPYGEGADGKFGAPRSRHTHQGQDIAAPEGTPVLAPRGGVVKQVAYQAQGAGHYVILDGEGEDRDYAFFHLQAGSIPVRVGQRVVTGERLGGVGNTGRSFGAHLHFEVWEGVGGWAAGSKPVDPLPYLKRWDSWS